MEGGVFLAILSVVLLVVSAFQFLEKGYLLNNAYLFASKEERNEMDADKAAMRPHYRQSGWVFLLMGLSFAASALYCFLNLRWLQISFWILIAVTLLYAVAFSVRMELHR